MRHDHSEYLLYFCNMPCFGTFISVGAKIKFLKRVGARPPPVLKPLFTMTVATTNTTTNYSIANTIIIYKRHLNSLVTNKSNIQVTSCCYHFSTRFIFRFRIIILATEYPRSPSPKKTLAC